jgi:hypothetical protein
MLPLLAICFVVMDSEISQPEISDCERSNFFTAQRLKESGCGLGFVAVSVTQDALCLHLCIILSLASERTIYGPDDVGSSYSLVFCCTTASIL